MKKNVALLSIVLFGAALTGCQSNATMTQDDMSNFHPKALPPAEMAQKMAALAEHAKEYQKMHPSTGVPSGVTQTSDAR